MDWTIGATHGPLTAPCPAGCENGVMLAVEALFKKRLRTAVKLAVYCSECGEARLVPDDQAEDVFVHAKDNTIRIAAAIQQAADGA